MEFSDKPHIYNEFLEIMKNFKAQTINTPGVIERVKNLFRGYNKLILGFNTFLPEGEGYKIELTAEEEAGAYPGQNTAAGEMGPGSSGGHSQQAPAAAKPPQQMQQQHAISYVTTIRNRFANEPDTYRAFLKILHTYQKEQKGIKDVLEQVSLLFADHPDLLMEFTYFLPDAVQDQAKERLNRAARESEMRRRMLQVQQQNAQHAMLAGQKRAQAGNRKNAQFQHQQLMQQQHAMQQAQLAQQRRQQKGFQFQQMRRFDEGQRMRESNHVSQTTERRFFDSVKDLLTSTTREGWGEFLKHLDLFANDAITKRDLIHFSADIFGAQGQDLLHELKRIMAARADFDGHGADMYYAIPTSEIDFNQCRKCTPSYRALPKDYPKPVCSERTKMEDEVLNDEWITFPFGHEDNYTFRHMMKNQHEEELFKCEEDRFEIDMIIDSNYTTIRILEPLAEEIANMRSLEESQESNAGPRFQLQLEKRNISCIHLNSISRLYGEHGAEILELLHKNPAGTIPIILKRLKQKDLEWRKARQDLNVKWKETVERNYEKSFDHRSFYFKKQDRRFCDPKQLCNDIREWVPAGEPGSLLQAGENTPTGPTDLHSTGGAATQASSTTVDIAEVELSQVCRSLHVPGNGHVNIMGNVEPAVPSAAALLRGCKAQLNLRFPNKHHGIHKDIYAMFCHVAETANFPASDKERVSFIWRDLLRPFFNLPVHYLYADMSSTAASVLADGGAKKEKEGDGQDRPEGAMDVDEGPSQGVTPTPGSAVANAVAAGLSAATLDAIPVDASEAWPPGLRVLTAYGNGVVLSYRPADAIYVVGLCFGKAFCKASAIIGAEELSAAALGVIDVKPSPDRNTAADLVGGQVLPTVGTFVGEPVANVAPAATAAPAVPIGRGSRKDKAAAPAPAAKTQPTYNGILPEPCRVLFSTPLGYTFIRMYHTIYTRLVYARELGETMRLRQLGSVPTGGNVHGTGGRVHPLATMEANDDEGLGPGAQAVKPMYSLWMGQLLGLLDTTLDSARYEDSCRQLLGNRSYVLFTLDKLIQNCFRCLQQMANEESFNKLVGLFVYHRSRSTAFSSVTRLAENCANYSLAATALGLAAPVEHAPTKKRGTPTPAAGGAIAIRNIESVCNNISRGGMDPIAYVTHTAKLMENNSEDIYRVQMNTDMSQGPFNGVSVVTCQLLGPLSGSDEAAHNLHLACVGYAPQEAPAHAMDME